MNRISKTLLQVAAFSALSTGLGIARASDRVMVTIPFAFNVGDKTLPPGEYTISNNFGSAVVQIRDARYRVQAAVLADTGYEPAKPGQTQLVFRVHGNKHYLAATWNAMMGKGRELKESPAEREAEIAGGPTTQLVLVAHK